MIKLNILHKCFGLFCVGNRTESPVRARQWFYHWVKFLGLLRVVIKAPPGL